jgi:hypothetical protein
MMVESFLRGFLRAVMAEQETAPNETLVIQAREVAAEMQRVGMPLVMLELWLQDHRAADAAAVCGELQRAIDSQPR